MECKPINTRIYTSKMLHGYNPSFMGRERPGGLRCVCYPLVRQHHGQQDGEHSEGGGEVPQVVVVEEVQHGAVGTHAARDRGGDGRRIVVLFCK